MGSVAKGKALAETGSSLILLARNEEVSAMYPADDGFAMNETQAALYAASGRVSVFTARPVSLEERDLRYALEDAAIAVVAT